MSDLAPVQEMMRRNWITATDNLELRASRLQAFFGISTLDQEPAFWPHAARRTYSREEPENVLRAWQFRVKRLAEMLQPAATFTPKRLEKALSQLRQCLASPPEIRRVPAILGDAGVRFVVVEKLKRSRVDGICFWLDAKSPVIALSLRFDRIDWFWFTLMHELDHLRQGEGKASTYHAVDVDLLAKREDLPEQEQRANRNAAAFLVDPEALDSFITRVRPLYSKVRIQAFAGRWGVHPGLVVGQLQHREEIPYAHSRDFLVEVRQHLEQAALVDGWGHMPPAA
jgi:HTH-type transcriptional regulator/antitoxin HigA